MEKCVHHRCNAAVRHQTGLEKRKNPSPHTHTVSLIEKQVMSLAKLDFAHTIKPNPPAQAKLPVPRNDCGTVRLGMDGVQGDGGESDCLTEKPGNTSEFR